MKSERLAIWISILVFSILSIWMAIASRGFLEADDITHYLARRFAFDHPVQFVSVWNRPLCVMLYCVPARFGGVLATRIMTLALVMFTLWLTILIAKRLDIARPSVVTIFFLSQPLLFAHSFAALTEIPFAMLLAAMMYAYVRRWFVLLAVLAAISPLGRPEGFGILLLMSVTLLCHRKFYWLWILPLGVAIWSYAGWTLYGRPAEYPWYAWLKHNWPYSPESAYGARTPMWQKPGYFIAVLPAIIGPFAFPLIWIGVCKLIKPRSIFSDDHLARCRAFAVVIPLGILVIHSLLWTFGKMASNGEPRYMVVAASFWAILASCGWEWTCKYLNLSHSLRWPALGVVAVLIANKAYPCFPLGIYTDDRLAIKVCDWMDAHRSIKAAYPKLSASLPQIFLQLDVDPIDPNRVITASKSMISSPPDGVLLIWDDIYSQTNSNRDYCISEEDLISAGWQPIHRMSIENRTSAIFISPRSISGGPSELSPR